MRNLSPAVCVAAAGILAVAAGCSKTEEREPEPVVPVLTAPAKAGSIQRFIDAQAIVHPIRQAAIVPKINAPVREFLVNRGEHVRKGQLLAVLENRDLEAAALESKGTLDQAEANYRSISAATMPEEVAKSQAEVRANRDAMDTARKVYESRRTLYDQGALPRKQLDEAQVAYAQARSQYEIAAHHLESLQKVGKGEQIKAAQAQVEAARGRRLGAEAQLSYSRITSPIDGVVTDRPLYAGEMASSGAPLLTVMDVTSVVARANIPIGELRHVTVGDAAVVSTQGNGQKGRVTVVSPALSPNSTTSEVWIQVANPGGHFKPGMSVNVSIAAEMIPNAVIVPAVAIIPAEDESSTVFVVGSDSLAHRRKVEIGIREGEKLQILKGVAAGEQVITEGGYGLADKTRVRAASEKK